MDKICYFIGHSKSSYGDNSALYEALDAAVKTHITEYGVTEFRVGNYGFFDRASAEAVKKAKERHPEVRLYLMLPYLPDMGRPLPNMEGYDASVFPEGMEDVPPRLAISRLNRLMVKEADYIIAYVNYSWGGAAKTLDMAIKRARRGELSVLNLGTKQIDE